MKSHSKCTAIVLSMFLLLTTVCHGQETVTFNRDLPISITLTEFDKLVNCSIRLLKTKNLSEISDLENRNIMMCLNTILMASDTLFKKRFTKGIYESLEKAAKENKYTENIIKLYPEWRLNRGMGFYFPKLEMELYGTPSPYAWFQVKR